MKIIFTAHEQYQNYIYLAHEFKINAVPTFSFVISS